MKTDRADLLRSVHNCCESIHGNKKDVTDLCNKLFEDKNIPYEFSNDIITLRVDGSEYDDFILFSILELIRPNLIEKHFTESEITRYSEMKYVKKKYKFPKLKMIEVQPNSWIGKIQASELIKMRDARLINYNTNTQRPMSKKTINGIEYYYITINENAVSAIMESFRNGTYIPNTITLNIPESADFYYDQDAGELVIKEIEAFDILDGYHRYVALQRLVKENKSFDYTMELRIVYYSEEKAKQFIWQEDQKTKMSKIDSDSMNQTKLANQIVSYLNQKHPFTGIINSNASAIINAPVLSVMIDKHLINGNKSRSFTIELQNKLFKCFNSIIEEKPELLDKKWSIYLLTSAIFFIYKDVPIEDYPGFVFSFEEVLKKKENEIYMQNYKKKTIRKVDITRLEKLYEENFK